MKWHAGRARTALHYDCPWLEHLHDLAHDGLEQRMEGVIRGAILKGHVDRVEATCGAGARCDWNDARQIGQKA